MPVLLNTEGNLPALVRPRNGIYGARLYKSYNGTTTLERLDDAVGLSATASVGYTAGVSDFDNIAPWSEMKRCNIRGGSVAAWEGDSDFAIDGTNGDTMVCIPKFWYKIDYQDFWTDFYISATEQDGFHVSPAHDRPWGEADYVYVGAYRSYYTTGVYSSRSGVTAYATARSSHRSLLKHTTVAKENGYFLMDYQTAFCLRMLYLIEYADTGAQRKIGLGVSTSTATVVVSGGTNNVAGHTGAMDPTTFTTATAQVKYRYVEDLWGNALYSEILDGVNYLKATIAATTAIPYICVDPRKYADSFTSDYLSAGVTTIASSTTPATGYYIQELGSSPAYDWFLYPVKAAGSAAMYWSAVYGGSFYNATTDMTSVPYAPVIGGGISTQGGVANIFCDGHYGGVNYNALTYGQVGGPMRLAFIEDLPTL